MTRDAEREKGPMKSRAGIALAVLAMGASVSLAQQETTPKPGPEMRRLIDTLAGTWNISEVYEPSEWAPKGGTGRGQEVFRAGPGGLSLIEDYRSTTPTGELSGLSVTWWDGKAGGYRAIWCDSTNPGGCVVMSKLATWEGDRFVLGDDFERNGKKVSFREVLSDITPTSFTQTIYQGESGGEPKRMVTIRATKSAK